jgi:hypothetical protein
MNFADYLISFSALIILVAAIRHTWIQWKNFETQETITLRSMLVRYAGERERLVSDRDHWMKEATDRFIEMEELRKKLAHLRRQIPVAKLREIDDSWHGELP